MILVDTSIWVDHLRDGDAVLASLLASGTVLGHPFVIGELAMGNLRQRYEVLDSLQELPRAIAVEDGEALHFINRQALFGSGISYVDAHLLASARLTADALLWTRDKRLLDVATRLGLAAHPTH